MKLYKIGHLSSNVFWKTIPSAICCFSCWSLIACSLTQRTISSVFGTGTERRSWNKSNGEVPTVAAISDGWTWSIIQTFCPKHHCSMSWACPASGKNFCMFEKYINPGTHYSIFLHIYWNEFWNTSLFHQPDSNCQISSWRNVTMELYQIKMKESKITIKLH